MRTTNPVLTDKVYYNVEQVDGSAMTIQGTINKTLILLLFMFGTAVYSWNQAAANPQLAQTLMMVGVFGGLIMALILTFAKTQARFLAPAYALLEGLFIGAISAFMESVFPGIVVQAMLATMGTLGAMLFVYKAGWVTVTDKFRLGVAAATGGIFLVYLFSMILGFFGVHIPYIHEGGPIGILFSVAVIVIASMNLILDFDLIERGARGLPGYMEWFSAFALLVTLIWLYIEFLRLLSKMRSR